MRVTIELDAWTAARVEEHRRTLSEKQGRDVTSGEAVLALLAEIIPTKAEWLPAEAHGIH
jgi:hypothetical protein